MVRLGTSLGSKFRSGPEEQMPNRAPGPWTRRRLHNRQPNAWAGWGGPRDDRLTPDGRPGLTEPLRIPPVDASMGDTWLYQMFIGDKYNPTGIPTVNKPVSRHELG